MEQNWHSIHLHPKSSVVGVGGAGLVVIAFTYVPINFQIHAVCKNCKDNSEIILSQHKTIPSTRIPKSSSDSMFFRLQTKIVSVDDKDISCCVILIMVSFNALHKERSGTFRGKEMKIR